MNAYDISYKKLNKAQKLAVDTIEGPVMVIAGPGTGKTTILTLRIANILRQTDTPPSGILAITFTDAGVKAMRMKLREIIGGRADEVSIFTFHGFATMIIADFRDHFPHLDGTKQMTDIDAESLVRNILSEPEYASLRPLGNTDFYISSILRAISDAKKEAHTPEYIRDYAKKRIKNIKNDDESYSRRGASKGKLKAEMEKEISKAEKTLIFADLYSEYEKRKRIAKQIDYDDLIVELLVTLKNDELLLRLLQERYLYIHVDEHQDTNDSQNLLITMLAEFFDTPNVFIVGDEKQAIYRFQGASVENFLQFENKWQNMKMIPLTENYRSHQHILDASFNMIEHNYTEGEHGKLRIRLKAGTDNRTKPIDLVSGKNTETIQEYLAEAVKEITKKEPTATVAILTKTNKDIEKVVRFLESKHIAVSSERSIDIFNHPAGIIFFDLIGFLVDPSRKDLLAKTLAVGLWNIPFDESMTLIAELRSHSAESDNDNTFIEKRLRVMKSIHKSIINDGAIQCLVNIAELSSYLNFVANDFASTEVWRGIVILSESLIREGNIENPRELFEKLLAYKMSSESRSVKVPIGTPDLHVKAMTTHGSKGLEFDYVFIPFASEEFWIGRKRPSYFTLPISKSEDAEDYIRDARRLFYVAITRARKHVIILNADLEDDGRVLTPLRFIKELDEKSVRRIEVDEAIKNSAEKKPDGKVTALTVDEKRNTRLVDIAKNILLKKGLSVTALNHFIECPSNFLYQSILKLPQAPSASAEKGNAMHLAISRIWKSKDRDEKDIKNTIEKTIEEHFTHSLLPVAEKSVVKKELLKLVPAMSKSLANHFAIGKGLNDWKQIFAETWSEYDFIAKFAGEDVKIPMHGKLDAILDLGREVLVFDYKTRGKMSVAEIKGETKTSESRANGGYMRQLVFYRLLLEDDSRFKNRNIIPSLVFLTPDKKGECATVSIPILESDILNIKSKIQELIQSVWSGKILTDTCDDRKCEWCGMKAVSIFNK